ncbi:MAG: hypothetical protein ACYCTE_14420 [Acidimicrobiales bacterium]
MSASSSMVRVLGPDGVADRDAVVSDLAAHTLDEGFLLIFHERRADGSYTMDIALPDETAGRVLARRPESVLSLEQSTEHMGDIDDIVFIEGAHLVCDGVYLACGTASFSCTPEQETTRRQRARRRRPRTVLSVPPDASRARVPRRPPRRS